MNETFRLRQTVKYQGMALTALFLAVLVGCSSILFLEKPAEHGFKGEHSVAIVFGMSVAVFGTMLLMSIYTWASYYVERFTINGTMLSIRSMLQDRQFDVSELDCLKWRVGGSILFRVFDFKARLDLYGYSKDDRLRIIRALHDLVPPQVQEEWPLFCHEVALPLRDGKPSIVRGKPSLEYTITRKRYDRMLVLGFPMSVALAIALWAWLNLWKSIGLPFLVIAAWLLLRFNVPPEGRTEVQLTSTSQGRAQILGWGGVMSSLFLMTALLLLGVGKSVAGGAACVLLVVALPPTFYMLHKSNKQRRIADEQATELAPADWQQDEVDPSSASST